MNVKTMAWAGVLGLAAAGPAFGGIAITEFIHDPYGADEPLEWIELFNFGSEAVNVAGWTLKDNATTRFTFPDFTIPSGGYAIAARDKGGFETRWLGGVPDARVVGGVPFLMNNGAPGDGLYLRDAADTLVWKLGYAAPGGQYRATWLTGNDFTITAHGGWPSRRRKSVR